jgi:heterotetrameric sarcosine oxidase gamma subunit
VSAPEPPQVKSATAPTTLAACAADIIELSAYIEGAAQSRRRVAGVELPPCGRASRTTEQLVVSTRPGRWLLLGPPGTPGASAERWRRACAGQAAVVELSSALSVLYLAGAQPRALLSRGCRLDLAPHVFRTGDAATSIMAQVAVSFVALPQGVLLLTPSSTAQHLVEWLGLLADAFNLVAAPRASLLELCGETLQ